MTDTGREPLLSAEAARALLLRVMRDDSEASYCAGWVSGNEFRLWCQVVRDPVVAGELREAILCQPLRELAAVAGGWWVWPEESTQSEPSFLTMSEWLPIYEAHRQRLIAEYGPRGVGGWAAFGGGG